MGKLLNRARVPCRKVAAHLLEIVATAAVEVVCWSFETPPLVSFAAHAFVVPLVRNFICRQ